MTQDLLTLARERFGKAKRTAKNIIYIRCPTCDPSHAKKMRRWIKNGKSNCWICEKKLDFEQLFGLSVNKNDFKSEQTYTEVDKPNPLAKVWPCTQSQKLTELPENHPAVLFLKKDMFVDLKIFDDYGIHYVPYPGGIDIPFDRFTGNTHETILFPIWFKNEYVGWQSRKVPGTFYGDKAGKMRYMQLFSKGNYLFNYDRVKNSRTIVVVEGIKKALKMPDIAVATLGKGISERQLQLIQEWDQIVLLLDAGEESQYSAENFKKLISLNGKRIINIDPQKHGFDNPDEKESSFLYRLIYSEWKKQYG